MFIDMSPSFRFKAHGDHNQRLLLSTALLFWLLGGPAHFPYEIKIQVGQSPLEPPSLALKPSSQAAVLGVDADTASRQVKAGKGKAQSHGHRWQIRVGPRH